MAALSLSFDEERVLIAAHQRGDRKATDRLVRANQGLVVKIAGELKANSEFEDCVSEGNLGLLIALDRFDLSRPVRFATYAAFWIRAMVHQYVSRYRFCVSGVFSSNANRKAFVRLSRARRQSSSDAELLRRADVSESMAQAFASASLPVRLNDYRTNDRPIKIPVPPSDEFENRDEAEHVSRRLRKAIDTLPEREQRILRQRYLSDTPLTLREIGQQMGGLSRERIRQLENRALKAVGMRLGGDV